MVGLLGRNTLGEVIRLGFLADSPRQVCGHGSAKPSFKIVLRHNIRQGNRRWSNHKASTLLVCIFLCWPMAQLSSASWFLHAHLLFNTQLYLYYYTSSQYIQHVIKVLWLPLEKPGWQLILWLLVSYICYKSMCLLITVADTVQTQFAHFHSKFDPIP